MKIILYLRNLDDKKIVLMIKKRRYYRNLMALREKKILKQFR